jgi:hypothetical protein
MKARTGGALFPVLVIVGILFLLSTMLPQVLVQAAGAIRLDNKRDKLSDALDSGVAFAEARLKRDLAQHVATGAAADHARANQPLGGWKVRPTFDNPDFGRKKDYDFEVRCTKASLWKVDTIGIDQEVYRYAYVLDVGAWDAKHGQARHAEITGLVTVTAKPGRPERQVAEVKVEGINRERKDPYQSVVPPGPSASP